MQPESISLHPRSPRLAAKAATAGLLLSVAVAAMRSAAPGPVALPAPLTPSRGADTSARSRFAQLPLAFVRNEGQAAEEMRFLSRGPGYSVGLTRTAAVLKLSHCDEHSNVHRASLTMRCRGKGAGKVRGERLLPGRCNYFHGSDRSSWRTGVKQYAAVRYSHVYPDIDLLFYGNQGRLEHDFVVQPGGDPAQIRFEWSGAERTRIDADGGLVLDTPVGPVRQSRPFVYQQIDGKQVQVAGSYRLDSGSESVPEIGFELGAYDHSRALIIDPVLVYSTYLGGSNSDGGLSIAVDKKGSAYITGFTDSTDFPTSADPIEGDVPGSDVFVTKLAKGGNAIVYSTYLGGSDVDQAKGIAVNAKGEAYVTGITQSIEFPTVAAFQGNQPGMDAFVAKLSKGGTDLLFSTYLGGDGDDQGTGIALDKKGNAYVTGATESSDFPISHEFQSDQPGTDAFVTKLFSGGGSTLAYSTYLGGSDFDRGAGIAVDEQGRAYVIGSTNSTDFPTVSEFQTDQPGPDVFVAKLFKNGGGSLIYSTYLGGSGGDHPGGIAVDSDQRACVCGFTDSTDFPMVRELQGDQGGEDAFAAKLFANGGRSLVYSTYLGGNGQDQGAAIAVDEQERVYVTGFTDSANFPTFRPFQTDQPGSDAFIIKLSKNGGNKSVYSSYLGGSGTDRGFGIAVDESHRAYVTGFTDSTNFPLGPAPFQNDQPGLDAFVTKLGP